MSQRLWLDYVAPPGSPWAGRLLLFGGLLLLAGLVVRHAQLVEDITLLEKSRHQARELSDAAIDPSTRPMDWIGLLPVLEAAAGTETNLLSLNSAGDVLQLAGEATNAAQVLDYVQGLRRSSFFGSIELDNTEALPGGPQPAIGFSCRATIAARSS